ncbi:MAG: hypothetical protein KTR32_27710 [Granulosicoccus sp.]|nr:hypothetical protein [Granulosicoccus sp.]
MTQHRVVREMAVTHGDFFRILPNAMGQTPYQVEGLSVTGKLGDGSVTISIGKQHERRIALLAIPYCAVSFEFDNVTDEQIDEFEQHFLLRYQRGGG